MPWLINQQLMTKVSACVKPKFKAATIKIFGIYNYNMISTFISYKEMVQILFKFWKDCLTILFPLPHKVPIY